MNAKPEPANPFREPISVGKLMWELLADLEGVTPDARRRS